MTLEFLKFLCLFSIDYHFLKAEVNLEQKHPQNFPCRNSPSVISCSFPFFILIKLSRFRNFFKIKFIFILTSNTFYIFAQSIILKCKQKQRDRPKDASFQSWCFLSSSFHYTNVTKVLQTQKFFFLLLLFLLFFNFLAHFYQLTKIAHFSALDQILARLYFKRIYYLSKKFN